MSALQRILDRMPDDAHRQSFLRIVTEAGVKDDSADMVFLALDHEARWAAVQAMTEERARIATLLDDWPDAMRAAGAEIVTRTSRDVAEKTTAAIKTAVQGDITANLQTQHAVSLEAHDRARRAIETLESRVAGHVHEMAAKTQRAMHMHSARYSVVIWTLIIALLFSIYHGELTGYRFGYSQAWSRAVATQIRMDARAYLRDPAKFRAAAEHTAK